MSVQFGRWSWLGDSLTPSYIEQISATLRPYAPDGVEIYSNSGISILYGAFHTTKQSHFEKQPHASPSGAIITWDGRLDNRTDLLSELGCSLSTSSTDVDIVGTAYEKWGTNCFAKLIGDWALSVWNPIQRSLILAKDPIGTRHLYYSMEGNHVAWSTILDPLVLFAGKSFVICEEYIAGWFGGFPAPHLTPYIGIRAVSPSSFVMIRPQTCSIRKFWDFNPRKRIRYRTDAEYEEHFRTVFAQAVRRRLRSDRPILAELSGGVDSSSIVCMADAIIARGEAETPRLDTISYYDDSNPILDERSYLIKVEQKRGRAGHHIDLAAMEQPQNGELRAQRSFMDWFQPDRLVVTPYSNRYRRLTFFDQYALYMRSHQYRVTLSGIAGEDPTGGYVPSPTPELQDLMTRARFLRFARQLNAWAVKMQKPRLVLLWQAFRGFFAHSIKFPSQPEGMYPPPWLEPGFIQRNHAALHGYPSKLRMFGALPSFQNQLHLLNHERRFLGSSGLQPELLREIRYPYLDRDLLEFACAIPREQIVGVGKRRFLMKRALVGIVPEEVLNRKRRPVATQGPESDCSAWLASREKGNYMISNSLGIVHSNRFLQALGEGHYKEEVTVDGLEQTLELEYWLRHLSTRGVLASDRELCKSLSRVAS